MKSFTPELTVPTDLSHLMDDRLHDTYDELADISYDEMKAEMPDPVALVDDESGHRFVILPGAQGSDFSRVTVLNLEHQQPWNFNHFVKARVLQAIVAPDEPLIIMPNNGFGDKYYDLSKADKQKIKAGSFAPIVERQSRTLEALGVETASATGYSLGGRLAVAMAGVSSDFELQAVNADEAPSKERSAFKLKLDFGASGNLGSQKRAMRESGLVSMHDSSSNARLLPDYAKFFVSGLTDSHSSSVDEAMASSIEDDVLNALEVSPATRIKLGHVAGSKLFDPAAVAEITGIRVVEYGPVEEYQGHTSANNPFIHALMAKDGLLS